MSKQTNLEYIKSIDKAERFAELFLDAEALDFTMCNICSHNNNCNDDCAGGVIEWLNMERVDYE